jgi:Helix-turn-helix domain
MPTREPIVTAGGEIRAEPLYDVDELARLLGSSGRTVRRRVNAGLWPHVRGKGGRLFFTAEHVRLIVAAFNSTHDYPAHEPPNRWEMK